jgi:hypothetical protein
MRPAKFHYDAITKTWDIGFRLSWDLYRVLVPSPLRKKLGEDIRKTWIG